MTRRMQNHHVQILRLELTGRFGETDRNFGGQIALQSQDHAALLRSKQTPPINIRRARKAFPRCMRLFYLVERGAGERQPGEARCHASCLKRITGRRSPEAEARP